MTTTSNSDMYIELSERIVDGIVNELNLLSLINSPDAQERLSSLRDIISTFSTQEPITCYREEGENEYKDLNFRINSMASTITEGITNAIGKSSTATFLLNLNWLAHTVAPLLNIDYVNHVFVNLPLSKEQKIFFSENEEQLMKIVVIMAMVIKTSDIMTQIIVANSTPEKKGRNKE